MSAGAAGALRIALLGGGEDLAAPLSAAGHDVRVVVPREVPIAEALLARRGFTPSLTGMPSVVAELLAARPHVAHAFTVPAATAALAWRRLAGRPVVFTCTEVLDRGRVADRRLRLRTLAAAIEDSDALLAATPEARDALARWMAVEAPVLDPADVAAHVAVYRDVLSG